MARPLRINYSDAFYHVTSRGNERKNVFKSKRDREKFFEYLESATQRYDAVIHAFCLMDNHYHLLIETPSVNMPHDLRQIPGRRFNQQVIMVAHKTEYMNNGIISLCGRLKIFAELFLVALTLEYIFPFITSGGHMIKCTRIIYPQGTSHI